MGEKSQDSDGEDKERDDKAYIGERIEKRGREGQEGGRERGKAKRMG